MKLLVFLLMSCASSFSVLFAMNRKDEVCFDLINNNIRKDDSWFEKENIIRKRPRAEIILIALQEEVAKWKIAEEREKAAKEKRDAEERAARERQLFVDNLLVEQSLIKKIKELPKELRNHIVGHFVCGKPIWHTTNARFKYAWGSLALMGEERIKLFFQEALPAYGCFRDKVTGRSFRLKMHALFTKIHMAVWNMDKTKLLTAASDSTVKLSEAVSGNTLITLVHDYEPTAAFFMHDEGSSFAANGIEDNMGIVTCDEESHRDNQGKWLSTFRNYTWAPYVFTFDQALLYKLLYTWLLVKKVDKDLFVENTWISREDPSYNDSLIPFIVSIESVVMLHNGSSLGLVGTWKAIPACARRNIWWDIKRIVKEYGK